ncbi:MAG TPA: co-chaperone GroES [Bacteroidales bacterium]|nr:co-chaperone GroES [Bacteroidales bacterium]
MKELQPINQLVVLGINDSKNEQRTSSGIIIPDIAKEKSQSAPVVWMSAIENAEIRPGDVVVYKPFAGTEIEFEGGRYLLMPYADVLAKVVETEKI